MCLCFACEKIAASITQKGAAPAARGRGMCLKVTTTYCRIRRTVVVYIYHTPLGRFFKLDCSTTKRAPIPNDTSRESSRRDFSKAVLFGTDTYSKRGDIDHGKSAQVGVTYPAVYGIWVCTTRAQLGLYIHSVLYFQKKRRFSLKSQLLQLPTRKSRCAPLGSHFHGIQLKSITLRSCLLDISLLFTSWYRGVPHLCRLKLSSARLVMLLQKSNYDNPCETKSPIMPLHALQGRARTSSARSTHVFFLDFFRYIFGGTTRMSQQKRPRSLPFK